MNMVLLTSTRNVRHPDSQRSSQTVGDTVECLVIEFSKRVRGGQSWCTVREVARPHTPNDTFNITLTMVRAVSFLTSGASIAMVPGQDPPRHYFAVWVGFPQTRKSQMTGVFAHAMVDDAKTTVHAVRLATAEMRNCTLAAFAERDG